MINKLLCIILLFLFVLLIIIFFKNVNNNKEKNYPLYKISLIENFQDSDTNPWNENDDKIKYDKMGLNDKQKSEVSNMISQVSKEELQKLINIQSPLLVGPIGPQGPSGPTGGSYIATGKLANKLGSHKKGSDNFVPEYIATRTEGTDNAQSLSFMSSIIPYASYQDWVLGDDSKLKSRFDDNCLTFDNKNNKLFISECKTDNPNQNWSWDNASNRLISTNQNNQNLKCIGLTQPEVNKLTTNVPGCKGEVCSNNTERRFLVVKDCDPNNVKEDEVWGFI